MTLTQRFERETGHAFDPEGPPVIECGFCGGLLQFVTDHDCYGTRAASAEAARKSAYNLDYYAGRD